jgi:hypothetical protein
MLAIIEFRSYFSRSQAQTQPSATRKNPAVHATKIMSSIEVNLSRLASARGGLFVTEASRCGYLDMLGPPSDAKDFRRMT